MTLNCSVQVVTKQPGTSATRFGSYPGNAIAEQFVGMGSIEQSLLAWGAPKRVASPGAPNHTL
eukprot:2291107-Alexandrium_andersonii.AAC.1